MFSSKLALAGLLVSAAATLPFWRSSAPQPVHLRVTPAEITADGYSTADLTVESSVEPRLAIVQTHSGATLGRVHRDDRGLWHATLRTGVNPGSVTIAARTDDGASAQASILLKPLFGDREGDGMPDAVQLDSPQDREAFRHWFTFLAEAQFFQHDGARPVEIDDCAALIRYAYRESLRKHDAAWISEARLPLALGLDPVRKYQYPYTLLGASLFRVKAGAFQPRDLENGAFSQFADAETLETRNTVFVSRDIRRALPGDLLFYRHIASDMPFHSMIYVGRSQIHDDGQRYLLYHTGPDGSDPGEIRRPSIQELEKHPDPSWHPSSGNPHFLGVYRWTILR